ncbi:hypothetical protein V6V47_16490 [Micromonospora sp. CPCC 205539]|uniref:hypothetical protein n=1 Tax=Micromonospora sp. CPCC 205539 TaxID=3122408 RepID=UPI002FF3E46C
MTASAFIVAVGLLRVVLQQPASAVTAVLATAAYLPLHLNHVRHAAHGRRAPHGAWSVAVMATIILALLPVLGVQWFGALYPLGASVLLVMRPRQAVPVFAALVALPGVAGVLLGGLSWGIYFSAGVLLFGLMLAVPVWLVATVRDLRAAQSAVAGQAVVRERMRVEETLWRTLGSALEDIAAGGALAAREVTTAPDQAEHQLRGVIRTARDTLAEGRRLAGGFRSTGLRSELESAAALLRTTGIEVRLVLPPGEWLAAPPAALQAEVHGQVGRLLRRDDLRHCTIRVVGRGGDARVEFLTSDVPAQRSSAGEATT